MQYNREKTDCKNCCSLCEPSKKMFCKYNCEKRKNEMEFRVNINKDVVADNIKEQLKNKSINSMCNFS